ncbi:ParB N-terminal domain-containing protein [Sagittula sp. NFXS13]|uniref:ParB/RepB/Spo0J family partition protein n=1 Tax=Sagittula sp. NFXS13 TaxID=2819095 RepID=UPI0032DF0D99
MIERLNTITELSVQDIRITGRLRDVSPDGVETLKDTIAANGFVGRIVVRRTKKGDLVLDGAHRLTAMRELGHEVIPCDVIRCSDDEALMFEIDGNIAGAGMTALQLSYFLARRRETYQRLHPEAQQGLAGATSRWDATDTMSVAKAVAAERGVSERHVYRMMKAGAALAPDDYRRLCNAPRPIQLTDLTDISKIGEPSERYYVINALAKGEAKKASAARKAYRAEQGTGPTPRDATDAAHMRLSDAWSRANKAARRRFLEDLGAEVQALLDEIHETEGAV